jgi:hypothetical protein
MKKFIAAILIVGSVSAFASENNLFECNAKAIEAARAIDTLNFEFSDRSSVVITEQSQRKNTAKINVSFGKSFNRNYSVRLTKNRNASLSGDSLSEQVDCSIDSVSVN